MKIAACFLLAFSFVFGGENKLLLETAYKSSSPLEISGFVRFKGSLYAVSDNAWDTWLYKMDFSNPSGKSGSVLISKEMNIKKLDGYWPYYLSASLWKQGGRWVKAAWDLEGAAICGEDIYLVNEQVRHVLKIRGQNLQRIAFDFHQVFGEMGKPLSEVSNNAGFEGIAVDCDSSALYLAQERSPRAIIVADLKSKTVSGFFQTSVENNPRPDYADLFFDRGHLYILERNMRKILKVDPNSKKVVATASYGTLTAGFFAADLYDTGEPFGVGEALYMDEDHIYIGNDNNNNPFGPKAANFFGFEGNNSSVLKFKRPQGF